VGQRTKKGWNQIFVIDIFNRVFELPSPRNAQKRDKKTFDFFVKTFRHNVFCKTFYSVFELPSLQNTRKRDKTKKVKEKLTLKLLSISLEKVFDMDFLQKYLLCVFEPPPA
jgi:hypothetical protein